MRKRKKTRSRKKKQSLISAAIHRPINGDRTNDQREQKGRQAGEIYDRALSPPTVTNQTNQRQPKNIRRAAVGGGGGGERGDNGKVPQNTGRVGWGGVGTGTKRPQAPINQSTATHHHININKMFCRDTMREAAYP